MSSPPSQPVESIPKPEASDTPGPSPHSKPCTLCHMKRDVLIRCQIDETETWHFVCPGTCWKKVSGGQIDGDASHSQYRYGGTWRNKHEMVSGHKPKKSKASVNGLGDATESNGADEQIPSASDHPTWAPFSGKEEDAPKERKYTRNDKVIHEGKVWICRKSHWQSDSGRPDDDIKHWKEA